MKRLILGMAMAFAAVTASAEIHELYSITATGSAGKQWIKSDYTPKSTDVIEAKVSFTDVASASTLWCSRWNNTEYTYTCFLVNGKLRFDYNSTQTYGDDEIAANTIYTVRMDGSDATAAGKMSVNGEEQSGTFGKSGFVTYGTFSFFAPHQRGDNYYNVDNSFASMTLYYLKIWDKDGNLVRDYVPAENTLYAVNSLKRYGLYDRQTGKFNLNQSTIAAFLPGAVIQQAGVQVASADNAGVLSPAVGTYALADGESKTFVAQSGTNTTNWTRSRVTGYTLETLDLTTGKWGTPVEYAGSTYAHTQSGSTVTRLTWLWAQEARLVASAGSDGTVTVDGTTAATVEKWFTVGTEVSVVATAASAELPFTRWTGDTVYGHGAWQNPLALTLEVGKSVIARFERQGDLAALKSIISSATAGSTVTIPAGVYQLDAALSPSVADLTIRGNDDDPASVVLDGQGLYRCLYLSQANTRVTGLTLRNGYTTGGGAGVYASGSKVIVTNCVFENNLSVNNHGGGVYAKNGTLIVDCDFDNNVCSNMTSSDKGGSAIFAYEKSVSVAGCRFFGNRGYNGNCNGGGGTINMGRDNGGVIRDCTFIGNDSAYGSVICGCPALIDNCTLERNPSRQIFLHLNMCGLSATTTMISRCVFNHVSNTVVQVRGSGSRFHYADCQFNHCRRLITDNRGFLCHYDTQPDGNNFLSMSNCVVRDFSTGSYSCHLMEPTYCYCHDYYGCTFEDCYLYDQSMFVAVLPANGTMRNCRFLRNRTGNFGVIGGTVKVKGMNAVIESCLFVSNVTSQSAGVAINMGSGADKTSARIDNCTFAFNYAGGNYTIYYGGALALSSNTVVRNCLFYRNTTGHGYYPVFYAYGFRSEFKNSFYNCWENNSNVQLSGVDTCTSDATESIDLMFVDPDPRSSCDFSIQKKSPLVDAGMQLDYLTLRTRDITLQNRRLSGAAPDIGAWEYRFVRGAMLIFR